MSKSRKPRLYKQGLEEYPRSTIIVGNLTMAAWVALGTVGCWFLTPLGAWLYLAFAVIMIGVVLRKLLCVDCYYYDRWCATGWGKLTALMFGKGDEKRFGSGPGQRLAPITYGLLSILPVVFIVTSIFTSHELLAPKLIVLVSLLAVSFYSGSIRRKKTCSQCKMRLVCASSAAKGK